MGSPCFYRKKVKIFSRVGIHAVLLASWSVGRLVLIVGGFLTRNNKDSLNIASDVFLEVTLVGGLSSLLLLQTRAVRLELVVGTGAGAQVRPPPEHGGDEEQEVDDVRGDADHAQVVYDVHEQVGEV